MKVNKILIYLQVPVTVFYFLILMKFFKLARIETIISHKKGRYKNHLLNRVSNKYILRVVERFSFIIPIKQKCIIQSLALKYLFNKKGISTTMYLGVQKRVTSTTTNKLYAHAWIEFEDGNTYLKNVTEDYTIVRCIY